MDTATGKIGNVVYKSKIGWELVIPLIVVLGGCTGVMLYEGAWPGLLIMLVTMAFVAHLFFTTYYVVDGDNLFVRCGFSKQTVAISSIRKISDDSNWVSSPALSLDRLELFFTGYNSVVVSPKDKKSFILHLLQINNNIELKLSKTSIT
ncbi:PH domain-containing protein [Flavobacterium subsaxonicum]|uniref:PH domain-containing protein n=1 Tax=Flavobacterium subsaxonicum TaxID=426226 RepID=UPI000687EF60|nr:PH domain-containing protein [Flavobacterium subsaxonicum]